MTGQLLLIKFVYFKLIVFRGLVPILFLQGFLSYTQTNIVVNPYCEDYLICPDNVSQIDKCIGWWDFDDFGSPDYNNICVPSSSNASIPSLLGYQFPLSENGMIHSIVLTSCNPKNFTFNQPPFGNIQLRESFGGTFTRPLKPVKHYIEFYVNFTNYGWSDGFGGGEGRVATNAFDLLLLNNNTTISNSVAPFIDLNDVVRVHKENTVINDTVNWIKLSTCFVPKGGETFFAIGAFRDTNEILLEFSGTTLTNRFLASYYFDNFTVYECPTCCPELFSEEDQVYIYSNPSTESKPAQITVWLYPNTSATLDVYDSARRLVASQQYTDLMNTFSFEGYAKGLYHFTVAGTDGLKEMGKVIVGE